MSQRTVPQLSELHAFLACLWIVGMLVSPPVEAIAYAGLLPVAVLRWRELATVWRVPTFRLGCIAFIALLVWAALSRTWAPAGATDAFTLRTLTVPLLVVHAAPRMESVRLACLIGGGYRVAFGALTFVGVQFPALLIPHHSSQETPGLLAFGAASVSLLADAGLGPKFLASGCLGLWAMAAAQIQSRGTVIATLVGGAVGVLVACRERKQRLATAIVLLVLCGASGMALVESPLARKFAGGFREIWPSATTGTLDLSRGAIDSLLSRRLLIWDWTVNGVEQAPIQGHGAGAWQANFRSAIDANKGLGLVSWQSGSKPMTAQKHAHDLFLQVTYEYGLIGLGLLMTCLVMWGTSIWRHPDPSSRCFGMVLLLSLVISRLNGQGDLDSRVSALMFVAVAALASGAMLSRQGLPSTNAPSCGHDCPG